MTDKNKPIGALEKLQASTLWAYGFCIFLGVSGSFIVMDTVQDDLKRELLVAQRREEVAESRLKEVTAEHAINTAEKSRLDGELADRKDKIARLESDSRSLKRELEAAKDANFAIQLRHQREQGAREAEARIANQLAKSERTPEDPNRALRATIERYLAEEVPGINDETDGREVQHVIGALSKLMVSRPASDAAATAAHEALEKTGDDFALKWQGDRNRLAKSAITRTMKDYLLTI